MPHMGPGQHCARPAPPQHTPRTAGGHSAIARRAYERDMHARKRNYAASLASWWSSSRQDCHAQARHAQLPTSYIALQLRC